MTITAQHLIDAARAIGIEIDISPISSRLIIVSDGRDNCSLWDPRKDKSQLMDLQRKLRLRVHQYDGGYNIYDPSCGAIVSFDRAIIHEFCESDESFSTAIILAAAEIGRNKQ
jgi:hypothetical protein